MPEWLGALPQYRFGWFLFGLLAVLPAIVSGNMLVHAGAQRPVPWKAVIGNALVLFVCLMLMAQALWVATFG